jgi:hypothetical protein
MHGDKHPVDRKAALKAFSQGDVKVLLATDVAGECSDWYLDCAKCCRNFLQRLSLLGVVSLVTMLFLLAD